MRLEAAALLARVITFWPSLSHHIEDGNIAHLQSLVGTP